MPLIRRSIWVCLLLLAACAPRPPVEPPLPRMDQVRSRPPAHDSIAESSIARGSAMLVQRMHLPAMSSFDEALALLDTAALPQQTVELWRDNGIQTGLLPAARLGAFRQALAAPVGVQHQTVLGGEQWLALEPVVLRAAQRLEVTGADGELDSYLARPGRVQLLLRLHEREAAPTLELAPHHWWQAPRLLPRPAEEQALDGYVFEDLVLTLALRPETILVLAHLPRPATVAQTQPAEVAEEAPAPDAGAPAGGGPTLPRLGDLLLHRVQAGRPVRAILLLSPLGRPPAHDHPPADGPP